MQSEVTLKCRDGVDLLLPVEVAKESKTLDQILSNDLFMESMTMEIEMEDFNSDVMKVVVEYLHFKHKYKDNPDQANRFKIDPSISAQVMVCADYLNC